MKRQLPKTVTAYHLFLSLRSPSPMANPSPPPKSSVVVVVIFVLLITSAAGGIGSTADFLEITFALEALRNHDYTLFANAIVTSDLQYQLITTLSDADEDGPIPSFTLFAPKDDSLFALDMATDAAVYVNTLRYHSVPNHRLSFSDLQNLSSPILDTLLPRYAIYIGKVVDGDVFENAAAGVIVDGIRVSNPDLFLGSRIAVHGIDGILLSGMNIHPDFGGNANGSTSVESPAPAPDRYYLPPAPVPTFPGNIPGAAPDANIPGAPDGNIPRAPEGNIPRAPDGNIPVAAPSRTHDRKDKLKKSSNFSV